MTGDRITDGHSPGRTGVFPGTFNPPTVAHLAIAERTVELHGLERVDLAVSRRPLGKASADRPTFEERIEVLTSIGRRLGWLGVVVSDRQLIADLAEGYDLVIMGADKWQQIHELQFYNGSPADRDAALGRLPEVVVAPRADLDVPGDLRIDLDPAHRDVSSTLARQGRLDLMAPEAAEFARATGAWLS